MKQVKFGSFPLAEILPKERECLDKYLIKHFSDSISFKDTLINLSVTKNTFYVGPSAIVRDMMKNNNMQSTQRRNNSSNSNAQYEQYNEVMKRAFSVLKHFYVQLSDSPFYKGMVYYPIYIEKLDKTDIKETYSSGDKLAQKFNYSFILLTNSLLDNGNTGRMKVNEAGVINFLYIYIHLFHSPFLLNQDLDYKVNSKNGLTSMTKENIVLIMRFYKLIQKYDLNPIKVFMSIYELIKEAKSFINTEDYSEKDFSKKLGSRLIKKVDKFQGKHFKNMLEKVVQEVIKLFEQDINIKEDNNPQTDLANANILIHIIELILKDREIFDFVDNLQEGRFSKDTRMQAVADYHHYQDIIGIFEALVAYNSLGITDIIKDMDVDFGQDILIDTDSAGDEADQVARLVNIIDRNNFDTAFNKFLIDFKSYIINSLSHKMQPILNQANKDKEEREGVVSGLDKIDSTISNLELEIKDTIDTQNAIKEAQLAMQERFQDLSNSEIDLLQRYDLKLASEEDKRVTLTQSLASIQGERSIRLQSHIRNKREDITIDYERVSQMIYNNIDDSLSFIYKDLENIYMNPMALNEILNNKSTFNYENLPRDFNSLKSTLEGTSTGTSTDFIHNLFKQLNEDIEYLSETINNEIEVIINRNFKITDNQKNDIVKEHTESITKSLGLRFFGIMHKYLRNVSTSVNKTLEYNTRMQGIHPLLGKMSRDSNNFKSFILSTNVLSALYDLIFITQEKMFLSGMIKRPPKKLNNTDNKVQFIVKNTLGLQNNPTWIIGENKIRLLLPDYLSLTGVPIASEIPKAKLQGICKLDYKDWWKHNDMGRLNSFQDDPENRDIKKSILEKQKQYDMEMGKPDKNEVIIKKLKNEIQALENKKLTNVLQGSNIGNLGRTFTSTASGDEEWNNFKVKNKLSTSNLSDEEADAFINDPRNEGKSDPRSAELDHGLESTSNPYLNNDPRATVNAGTGTYSPTGTRPSSSRLDDIMRARLQNR